MAEDANQHFVPQFYFRHFSEDGRSINLLLRKNGKSITSASIKGQASKKYFYGNAEAEQQLKVLDGTYSDAFRKVRSASNFLNCDEDTRLCFYQCLMLQRARTVAARASWQPMADRVMQLQFEEAINNDKTLDEGKRQQLLAGLSSIGANEAQSQGLLMAEAAALSEDLSDLLPIYLENRTRRPFVFSDAPVVFINMHYRQVKLRGVIGVDTPGLMIFYPLGPDRVLLLLDSDTYGIKGRSFPSKVLRSLSDVMDINKLQVHSASSAIYFGSQRYAAYVKELWHQEKRRLSDHLGKVSDASVVGQRGDPAGDEITHGYQPQLSFMPELSFLQYSPVVGDNEYVFSRRSIGRAFGK